MSFRRGSGVSAAITVLATIGIFGSQQAPAAAAGRAPAVGSPTITPTGSNYVPLSPSVRILDTRNGHHPLGPGAVLPLQVTGTSAGVPTGASAVVINVTAVSGTRSSYLTVYPAGQSRPNASNVNFPPGIVLANLVTSGLSSGGAVDIYNNVGTVDVLGDVEGYLTPQPVTVHSGEYTPIPPIRVCDFTFRTTDQPVQRPQ